jgi:hypothetical protein
MLRLKLFDRFGFVFIALFILLSKFQFYNRIYVFTLLVEIKLDFSLVILESLR